MTRWRSEAHGPPRHGSPSDAGASAPGVLGELPRRAFLHAAVPESAPPPPLTIAVRRVGLVRTGLRLAVWLEVLSRLGLTVLWDQVRGRNTRTRRARLLRHTLERAGGTFARIGQALAMRSDLLPWAYGVELARMLERSPAFPVAHAIAAVVARAGRPLPEIFEQFDPEPVGSTASACTYQAILPGGEKVIVKVLRPGVHDQLLADLRVCDWLATVFELTGILRWGSTSRLRRELRDTLLDELDFIREARQQDLFRRTARRSGRRFFTAPRVHFELSGRDVIVQQFVAGMWLWELLAAVEQNNEEVLGLARGLDIDPVAVARRLMWVNFWSWQENLFFLANPHPASVILGAHGTLTFIDFTSTGSINRTVRQALQQNMHYVKRRDPLNMARASLALLAPLPPLDVLELIKDLEIVNWQQLYVFATRPGTPGRGSAIQWLGLIQAARKYHITITSGVLRLLRATVLFETMAMRLDASFDFPKRYRQYARWRARRASRRLRRRLTRTADGSFDQSLYLRLEQLANTGLDLFSRLRYSLTLPTVNFNTLTSKGAFLVTTMVKLATQATIIALVVSAVRLLVAAPMGEAGSYSSTIAAVVESNAYRAVVLLLVFLNGRALLFRLNDKDA